LHCAAETRWQRFGQLLNDLQKLGFGLPYQKISLPYQKSVSKIDIPYQKSVSKLSLPDQKWVFKNRSSLSKIRVAGGEDTRWLGWQFLMVYRNNAGRLVSGFISVCLETRWLGQNRGFYEPEPYCN